MSNESKVIAEQFSASKEGQAAQVQSNNRLNVLLSDGFQRLRTALEESLPVFCDELNQEPKIGNILRCKSDSKGLTVTRTDTGSVMTAKFDPSKRRISFSCDTPFKFRESIEVKPNVTNTDCWLADKDGGAIGGDGSWVGENAVKALLGVQ